MNTCIVFPSKDAYSETFIRNHIERLNGKVTTLYGGWPPIFKDDGVLLLPPLVGKVDQKIQKCLNLTVPYFYFNAVRNHFNKNQVDVVLAEYGPTAVSMHDLCKKLRVPLVVHFHGYDSCYEPTLQEYRVKYKQMFEYSSAIISVSNVMTEKLVKLGADRNKIHCIPCGADANLFRPTGSAISEPILIAVGRFVDKKGPHLTILAFDKIKHNLPDSKLVMIGDGPLHEACQLMVKALKLQDRVHLLGIRAHQDVANLMANSRAFVQHSIGTSQGDSEGTPVAVMEASAIGLPVISTVHAGIPDVIVHDSTGYLVEEGDIDGMAAYMEKLLRDPVLAKEMGARGQKRINENYSLDISINKLSQVLMMVVNDNQPKGIAIT